MEKISERKTQILHAVIDSYIANAEPVSSKEIRDNYFPTLSSATIRSELAGLEDMGYLLQPHVSAGRIPTSMGYRLYVDKFMKKQPLTASEMKKINTYLDKKTGQVEELVRSAAKVISDVTNYTSVILVNKIEDVKIKEVKLVDLTDDNVLVIIITDSGIIKDVAVSVPHDITGGYINVAEKLVNNIFSGKQLKEVQDTESLIEGESVRFRELVRSVVEAIKKYQKKGVFLEGENKILNYPEYSDVEKAKNFLSLVDTEEKIAELVRDDSEIDLSVKIDNDGEQKGIDDCSIVTVKYAVKGKEMGQLGVIGPTRMNYDKVYSVLKYIANLLNDDK
ncbi:MAG: heat-inducible transcriptional repressor HrcA [Christensenellales bacterium]